MGAVSHLLTMEISNECMRYPASMTTYFVLINHRRNIMTFQLSIALLKPDLSSLLLLVKYSAAINTEALHRLIECLLPTAAGVAHLRLAFSVLV